MRFVLAILAALSMASQVSAEEYEKGPNGGLMLDVAGIGALCPCACGLHPQDHRRPMRLAFSTSSGSSAVQGSPRCSPFMGGP